MHLYLLGQCPELNSGHRLKLLILLRFKSFCPTLACTILIVLIVVINLIIYYGHQPSTMDTVSATIFDGE